MDIKNIFNKVNNYVNNKKEERELYNQKVANSKVFILDNDIVISNDNLVMGNAYEYNNMCPYIDIEFAKIIDMIIPINETVLYIVYITQKINNESYVMVFTDLRIIIMNKEKYRNLGYNNISSFEIMNKSLMSQTINFNGIILGIDINQDELNIIYNLITNMEYRNNYIMEKKKYLCGIIPIYQKLNKIGSGISIDSNNIVVFHDKKINNYICKYEDILNYEIMEDNSSVIKRKTNDSSHAMGFSKKECMHMTIRVTLVNNQVFEINILEPSTFNGVYSHSDSKYINEFNFAKEIIDKLDSMNQNLWC